ncbi:hypothetical protein D3C87_1433510 [compost metagenome]
MLKPSRAKIGTHSNRRNAGEGRSAGVQKRWMPRREKASSEASPERISNASKPHAAFEIGASLPLPRPIGLSRALSRLSLPMNPDSGGMPMISRAQAMKLRPRKAMVHGITWPTTALRSSSRLTPLAGCSDSSGRGSISFSSSSGISLAERERSINSARRNSALRARVELTR